MLFLLSAAILALPIPGSSHPVVTSLPANPVHEAAAPVPATPCPEKSKPVHETAAPVPATPVAETPCPETPCDTPTPSPNPYGDSQETAAPIINGAIHAATGLASAVALVVFLL